MEQVLMDEVVHTDYRQLDLTWTQEGGFDGDPDRFFAGQVNGLVGAAAASGVYLVLGRRSGGSHVRVVLRDGPAGEAEAVWEDVVEVSTVVPDGARPSWASWAGESGGELDGLAAGGYRVRVSARGRDAGRDGELAAGIVDRYLVELWPAAPRADAVLRQGSEDAASWHAAWGGRR